ncbi:serine/threonine protein kinase [Myxococcota bacterium]|nr:serine/threonine protein kinase [Myxococcota bacterium]
MRRPGTPLTHEVLVEEARFILRTLQRDDLFGDRVRLTEAERVIDSSISLAFADYCGFLNKYGYVRLDQLANQIEVTEGGALVSQDLDDAEFHARISRHFQRELGTSPAIRPTTPRDAQPPAIPDVPSLAVRAPRPATVPVDRPVVAAPVEEVLDRRYRRGEVIGTGTIGAVHRGQHVSLGRRIAIKEARSIFQFASYLRRDEIVRRIRTAIETHAGLVHPNIVQIMDQNPEREYPYFVMELAAGGNLRQRMTAEKDGQLSLSFAVRVLLQLAYALQFAHRQGVLHLGLKPENVLFDQLGNVKLSDFGFARITDRADEAGSTPVLVGGGTVGYMAPERLQPGVLDTASLGPAADIYGLGMLFYEMLTGKLPGRRSPLPSQARKDVPTAFDDVFDKMTRDELSERYASMDEVLSGIYGAFPSKDVFSLGTILFFADDPKPLPKDDDKPAPAPAGVHAPVPSESALPTASPALLVSRDGQPFRHAELSEDDVEEVKTGEIDVVEATTDAHGRRMAEPTVQEVSVKRAPPPPPPGLARKRLRPGEE